MSVLFFILQNSVFRIMGFSNVLLLVQSCSIAMSRVVPGGNVDSCMCTRDFTPVCGVDTVTYSNRCLAECIAVSVKCEGECPCKRRG